MGTGFSAVVTCLRWCQWTMTRCARSARTWWARPGTPSSPMRHRSKLSPSITIHLRKYCAWDLMRCQIPMIRNIPKNTNSSYTVGIVSKIRLSRLFAYSATFGSSDLDTALYNIFQILQTIFLNKKEILCSCKGTAS